jgi:hypothetical protein
MRWIWLVLAACGSAAPAPLHNERAADPPVDAGPKLPPGCVKDDPHDRKCPGWCKRHPDDLRCDFDE